MAKMGPPEKVTLDKTLRALSMMSAGASLRTAAESIGCSVAGLFGAIDRHGLGEQYVRACAERAATLTEQALAIADGTEEGCGDVQRDKLRVDTRKWFAARLDPKRWGDKVQTEISGPNGGPVRIAREMSDEELAEIAARGRGGSGE